MWKVERIILTVCSAVFLVILAALSVYKIAQPQASEVYKSLVMAVCCAIAEGYILIQCIRGKGFEKKGQVFDKKYVLQIDFAFICFFYIFLVWMSIYEIWFLNKITSSTLLIAVMRMMFFEHRIIILKKYDVA